ncbi:MAG TPA: type I glyceraldehyde-3-phosphate dehydrogenase [Acidimicrobiales bacterium]|nr:type I glyceraldehyde-3-phosphate dehydrogenase [Acidimicrobiales bacterium]
MTRVAINGFGRTGRTLLRAALEPGRSIEVVAVNDIGASESLARLFARDSVHGRYPEPVAVEDGRLLVGERAMKMLREPEAKALPWAELDVDVVIDCTGRFTDRARAADHLEAGARRVVISAPAKNVDATFVIGVNEDEFDPSAHFVMSNASCTTNCLALLAKVLDEAFGIEDGLMTTVHAYTDDQRLVDALHKDDRRGRAAALNIVPTTTGAARATGVVLPAVAGHLDGLALRVPVPDASVTDLVAVVRGTPTVPDVNEAYRVAAAGERLHGLLEYSEDPLVSSDIIGSRASCVFDAGLTMAQGRLIKVLGWYDNEMGYSHRLADLAALIA